ncbi:hypothetical protein [Vibrio spartinae]|uniref:hypothetical protein n=1 Tax=Vibrio spartinae TaxID=1918945 RepID=UPI0015F9A99D|nr:hypothetical protein [Vibrio spartinae]
MVWKFKEEKNGSPGKVEDWALKEINKLTEIERTSYKISISNMKGKDARAVLFYNKETTTPFIPIDSICSLKQFTISTDYSEIYNKTVNFLNDLRDQQANNARIAFTNAQGGKATIAIYYPN